MTKTLLEILIVEDDKVLREELAVYLEEIVEYEDVVFHTTSAEEYESALAMFKEKRVDGVILDLLFPKKGEDDADAGAKLLEEMRSNEATKDAAIVILTGYATVERAAHLSKRGASAFMQKPVEPDYLVQVLRLAINHNKLQKQLEELNMEFTKTRMTDAILNSIADNLNNIVGEAESIRDTLIEKSEMMLKLELDRRMDHIIDMAEQAFERAELSVHREAQKPEEVNILRVLNSCKEILDYEYRMKNIKIGKIPEVSATIQSYHKTISQVFYLLIEGVCEATAPGDKVEFSINDTEEKKVEVGILYNGSEIREDRLSNSRNLLRELLGDVKIELRFGKETAVIITIPSLENIIV